jgi:hypothetical protein
MERVAFLVEETDERIGCLLNPETLVMRRVAGVRPRRSATGQLTGEGLTDDPLLYTGGGRTELDLDLLFDVTLAGSSISTDDVRDLTLPLWRLAENADRRSGYGQPPLVRFIWGKSWNILGVVLAVSERLEYFTPEGMPRRSWLRLRMLRANEPPPESPPGRSLSPDDLSLSEEAFPEGSVGVSEVMGGAPAAADGEAQETPAALQADGLTATTSDDIASSALDESGARAAIDDALSSVDGAVRGMLSDLSSLSASEEGEDERSEEERAAAEAVEEEADTILSSLESVSSAVGAAVVGAVATATENVTSAMAAIQTKLGAMTSEAGAQIAEKVNAALETIAPAIEAMREAAAEASEVIKEKAAAVVADAVRGLESAAKTIEAGLETVTVAASAVGERAVARIGDAAETVGQILEEIITTGETLAREKLPAVLQKLASGAEGLWAAGETAAVKAVESAARVVAIALKNVRAAAEATASLLVRQTARGVRAAVGTIRTALEALRSESEDEEVPSKRDAMATARSRIDAALSILTPRADQETQEALSGAVETLRSEVGALADLESEDREAALDRIAGALESLTGAVDTIMSQQTADLADRIKSAVETGQAESEEPARRAADRPRMGPGQRLDLLAHQHYGNPALWRVLAAFNDVEHPLHLTSGRRLRVPPASALRSGEA